MANNFQSQDSTERSMSVTKRIESWDNIEIIISRLANKIKQSKEIFDIILGIDTGGDVPAFLLSKFLNIPRRMISKDIPIKSLKKYRAQKVLFVDDLLDSGYTFEQIQNTAQRAGITYKIATLFWKPFSSIDADFYVYATTDFIVFPWERLEINKT